MASYEKRGRKTRVRVRVAGGYQSATFATKAQAAAWAMEMEAGARGVGGLPPRTVHEALTRYAEEVSETKRGKRWEQVRLKALQRELPNKPLHALTADDLGKWRDGRLAGTEQRKKAAGSSINREMNLLASVFETARIEWKWVRENPIRDVRRPPNPQPRKRLMTDRERDQLCLALGLDDGPVTTLMQEIAVAMLVALETGMRSTEITGLEWPRVHLKQRFVELPKTKNGDARDVPLSTKAVELIERMKGRDPVRVFTVDPGTRDVLFRRARERCKIEGLTFHDTRATACTRLARKVDVLTLAKIIGHRDPRSLMVYYRESAASIATRLD
jgi:integrase